MEDFNPSINVGPLSFSYSDVSAVFKVIAESFSSGKDPDKGIKQLNILLENEILLDNTWISNSYIELTHTNRGGLKVLYHYNSEALGRKQLFNNYAQDVNFSNMPKDSDTTLFFIARNAVANKSNHQLNNKNAIGFIALFTPPIPKNHIMNYEYHQTYDSFTPLWGEPAIELNKDYRFLRDTKKFVRVFRFPLKYYKDVRPDCFLLNKGKNAKLEKSNTINFEKTIQGKKVTWRISVDSPPTGSVLRVKWERPIAS